MYIYYAVLVTIICIYLIYEKYCNFSYKKRHMVNNMVDNEQIQNIDTKWKLIMDYQDINNAVDKCANYINNNFKNKDVLIVCILKGAVYFFVDLTRKLIIPHSCYFIETTSYHDNQMQSKCNVDNIMGSINPSKFKNKHIILIDELFDNGQTIYNIKHAIHNTANVPLNMILTCVAFKKTKDTLYEKPDFYGSCVPNVWLVGYGLDDKQQKRNYKDLWGVPKEFGIPYTDDDKIFTDNYYYENIRKKIITH